MVADPTFDTLASRRFTVDEYEFMGRVGVLTDDERTELLDGKIVPISPTGSKHASVVERIVDELHYLTRRSVTIRSQNPVRLIPDSEPEPDVLVARRRQDFYASAHPTAEDIHLLIEVSDSTLVRDQQVKLPIYASQYIVEVWIVDVKAGVVHVYTDPDGDGYRTERTLGKDDVLVPTEVEDVRIPVSDIL